MSDTLTTLQTAEFLGMTESRVKRLARESLLNDVSGNPDSQVLKVDEGERYKELAERIGGI